MASGPTSPQPRGALLGRGRELADLTDRLDLGGTQPPGSVHAVLVAGDAGMGKTRLLAELTARASTAGWRVMVGHCLDLADLMIPYLPFSELMGRFADDDPDTAREVVRLHPAIAALAPGRRLMSGTDGGRVDRAEIFEHVHATLDTLSGQSPVLVVVEDLHWADQ